MYLPQFLAVQLPRDELLLDYADIAYENAISPILKENLGLINEKVLDKLRQYFNKIKSSS